jgi:hypothetical protein
MSYNDSFKWYLVDPTTPNTYYKATQNADTTWAVEVGNVERPIC